MNPKLTDYADGPDGNGLGVLDIIRLEITGSRGGGPVGLAKGLFNFAGKCITECGDEVEDMVALNFANIGVAANMPKFPQAEYDACGEDAKAKMAVMATHSAALASVSTAGGLNKHDGIVEAVLEYCYDSMNFSPTDVDNKYVVTKDDIVLTTDSLKDGGTEYTVRLAAKFGA